MSPEILRISCSFDKRPNNGSRSALTSFRSRKLCLLLPLGVKLLLVDFPGSSIQFPGLKRRHSVTPATGDAPLFPLLSGFHCRPSGPILRAVPRSQPVDRVIKFYSVSMRNRRMQCTLLRQTKLETERGKRNKDPVGEHGRPHPESEHQMKRRRNRDANQFRNE